VNLSPRARYATGAERRLHLRDLLQVVLAHWKVVALVTAIVVGATWSAGRGTVQRYQSSAIVRVNSRKGIIPMADINVEEMALRTDPVISEVLVLTTQTLGFTVADALGLQVQVADPLAARGDVVRAVRVDSLVQLDSFTLHLGGPSGWQLRDARGQAVSSGAYETPATGPGFSFVVVPSEEQRDVHLAIIPRVSAADLVRSGISYQVETNTNVVQVTYSSSDRSLTPLILNAAVQALANYGADQARQIANDRLRYISERLEDARQRYTTSLEHMQRYEEQQASSNLSAEEVALIGTIQDYERERQRRQVELATVRSILGNSSSVSLETVNRLAAVAAISSNPAMSFQLENLLRLYDQRRSQTSGDLGLRENNPQIVSIDQRISQASQGLLDATQATIHGLETSLASLEQQIRDLRTRMASFPGRKTQFAQLQLDADLQNDTYKYLLSQFEAARISAATISPYVQIVESATEAAPIGVNHRQKLVIGGLVGIFLGLLAAFFLEYLDQTLKTSADVEQALDVPVLGLIPEELTTRNGRAGEGRRRTLPLVSLVDPEDPSSEAYRTLRTNVTFVNAGQKMQCIVVTSPGPGEGKSTTAANLAITLAQQGARTLLVDADLRRPIVHRAFNLVQEPGLTDVLVGTTGLREAIRPNVAPKLDLLPAGPQPPNPSELLGSEAMQKLVAQLRGQYEMVVFDSPPILAVTDATVLGAASDAVILVLRAGETEEAAAQRALQQLRRVQARVAGAVLNGIERRRDRYYNRYYNYRDEGGKRGAFATLRRRLASML
jgi:tyrosine-protein kinase Etk/Wzc